MYIIVFLFLMSIFLSAEGRKFSESLKHLRCSKSDNFNACVVKNGNLALPIVAEGFPEVNSQKFNPLKLSFVQLILVSSSTISLNLTDVSVFGLNKLQIKQAMMDFKREVFWFSLLGQNVTIDANYDVSGQVLLLPIEGSEDGMYNSTLHYKKMEKNGIKYIKGTGNELTFKFEFIQFKLDNLFDGNKQLRDEMNKVLNENWQLLLDDFGPGIADTISNIHRKNFDDFISDIPHSELYLE